MTPADPDVDPCTSTDCHFIRDPVTACAARRCPFRWQREAAEDRAERDRADRLREEGGE